MILTVAYIGHVISGWPVHQLPRDELVTYPKAILQPRFLLHLINHLLVYRRRHRHELELVPSINILIGAQEFRFVLARCTFIDLVRNSLINESWKWLTI